VLFLVTMLAILSLVSTGAIWLAAAGWNAVWAG
jgi:hypothetical protein